LIVSGGGFAHGSKEGLNRSDLQELLDARISVASINYRLLEHAPLPAAHEFESVPDSAHNPTLYYEKVGEKGFRFHADAFIAAQKSGSKK
jgi:hypothetical protein